AGVDDPQGRYGAAGRGRDPHRLREGLHPRRGDRLRGLRAPRRRGEGEGAGQDAARRQGVRRAGRRRHALPLQRLSPVGQNGPMISTSMVPAVAWLRAYDRSLIRADVVAGLTASAIVIPKAMAYATIAGLPL